MAPPPMPGEVAAYLVAVAEAMRSHLGESLAGLYLQGSAAQGDWRAGRSDLDLVGVTGRPVPEEHLRALARDLAHERLPVPAAGLDLMVVTEAEARAPGSRPAFELWFCTGPAWPTEVNIKGATSEIVLSLATCAEGAGTVAGRDAREVFGSMPRPRILRSMADALEWHRSAILDEFHDPLGQHSILNAARNWMYAEEQRLGSKSEGGRWVLGREPGHDLVRGALSARDGQPVAAPCAAEIEAFLERVLATCREKLV